MRQYAGRKATSVGTDLLSDHCVRRLRSSIAGSPRGDHRHPCSGIRAGAGPLPCARERDATRNLRFLCGVWPGRTPVEGVWAHSFQALGASNIVAPPSRPSATADGRGRDPGPGRARRARRRAIALLAVGSLLTDASEAAGGRPAGARSPSSVRFARRNPGDPRERSEDGGDA